MLKRKQFDEQGGSSQKAARAKAVAAEHGIVDDVQQPKKKEKRRICNTGQSSSMELASKMELGQNELHSNATRSLQQLHGLSEDALHNSSE